MSFVQVIEYVTSRPDDLRVLSDEWRAKTEGRRTAARAVFLRDRGQPDHYLAIVEFPSYEEAMDNSRLPETDEFARRMSELCDEPARYRDLDVIQDERA